MDANWVVGGAALGLLATCWKHIKDVFDRAYGMFVVRAEIEGYSAVDAVSRLVLSEFSQGIRVVPARYRGCHSYVRPIGDSQLVGYEMLPTSQTVFWRGWRPIFVKGSVWGITVEVSTIRGVYNMNSLIEEAIGKFNKAKNGEQERFFMKRMQGTIGDGEGKAMAMVKLGSDSGGDGYFNKSEMPSKYNSRVIGWEMEEIGYRRFEPMGLFAFPEEAEKMISRVKNWKANREWFIERGIPWKMGWLLYGKPGTGKTSFVRCAGQTLNMPIFSFDLSTMNNKDFCEAWEEMMSHTPCFALFEDIDSVFEGRKNVANTGDNPGLTFDCLLNVVDGVESSEGVICCFTTNRVEVLDPALAQVHGEDIPERPGRVDHAIKFDELTEEGRRKIAKRVMMNADDKAIEDIVKTGNGDTGARFQERCRREALKLAGWE